jgi:hypothetical protein
MPSKVFIVTYVVLQSVLFVCAQQDLAVLSGKCKNESIAIANNSAVTDEAPFLKCTVDVSTSKACTVDYMTVSADYEKACVAEGGQLYTKDLILDCSVTLEGKKYKVMYNYLNLPGCFGISCNTTDIGREFEASFFPEIERQFSSQGFICEASNSNSIVTLFGSLYATVIFTVVTLIATA